MNPSQPQPLQQISSAAPSNPQVQPQMILPSQQQNAQNPNAAALGMTAITANQANPGIDGRQDDLASTQANLQISEIRDNMVIMKDGSFRAVIACKSINFDLMSDNEREAVEYSYQSFLNSLKAPIQILVRSQKVDIGPYIEKLIDIRRKNDNMLLGVLMDDYIEFIDALSREANIMDKSFFIVVPFYPTADLKKAVEQTKKFFGIMAQKNKPTVTRIDRATYDKAISELSNSTDSIISGLMQMSIQAVRLNTRELGELYYNFNNPDTAVREPLVDFSQLATMYVKKGEKQNG